MHTRRSDRRTNTKLKEDCRTTYSVSHAQCAVNDLCYKTSQAEKKKFFIKRKCLLFARVEKFPYQPADKRCFEGKYDEGDMFEFQSIHLGKLVFGIQGGLRDL